MDISKKKGGNYSLAYHCRPNAKVSGVIMPSFHLMLPIKCGRHMTPVRLATIQIPPLDLPPFFASLS